MYLKRFTILVLLLLTGCSGQGISVPDIESTATKEIIIEPTPTELLSPTATTAPTNTSEPTPITVQEPFTGMKSPGPWMVFHTDKGTYIISQDGNEVGFVPSTEESTYRYSWPAPSGGLIATMSQPGYLFEVRSIKDNEVLLETRLLSFEGKEHDYPIPEDPLQFEIDRHYAVGKAVWSHDGKALAFNASITNRSSDLFTFDIDNKNLSQITNTPHHAAFAVWSPDDKFIFHADVDVMFRENNGSGFMGWKYFSSKPDGSETRFISNSPLENDRSVEEVIGWYSNNEILLTRGYWWCGITEINKINILTGGETPVFSELLDLITYSPETQNALAFVHSQESIFEECNPELESGYYLISIPNGQFEKLNGFGDEFMAYFISYDALNDNFLIEGNSESRIVDSLGETKFSGRGELVPSPDGKWVIDFDLYKDSIKVVDLISGDAIYIETSGEVSNLTWESNSSAIYFVQKEGRKYFLYKAIAPEFVAGLLHEDIGYPNNPPIWVNP